MKSEEIDAMPAGPEMDRVVHEALAGMWREQGRNARLGDGESIPPYSTSLPAAIDLLYTFSLFEVAHYEKGFHAQVRSDAIEWYGADADTLPLAICRAALRATLEA